MHESISQLIVVLVIFVGVLLVTYFVTKWITGYTKAGREGSNVELIESAPLAAGKYIQIVRLADKYVALAVFKDGVTKLCELDAASIEFPDKASGDKDAFRTILDKVKL